MTCLKHYRQRAVLSGADLSKADLKGANLSRAFLEDAKLGGADLSRVDLHEADLSKANLNGAYLVGANLREAGLTEANLNGADLSGVNLTKAEAGGSQLLWANLRGADLREANLGAANLSGANLKEADLGRSNLSGARLVGANIDNASVAFANLAGSEFQPETTEGLLLIGAKGLSTLLFTKLEPIVELRKKAKESGLRNEERALTSALRKYRLRGTPIFERIFEYVRLDLLTDYGENPWRSLEVLFALILIFSIPYTVALRRSGVNAIYRVWLPERVRKDLGEDKPTPMTAHGCNAWIIGLYFSFVSAFSIGWRDLNLGNWIARIQCREYNLRATGWARTISGLQSLISVYLLVLWALTYFGSAFE